MATIRLATADDIPTLVAHRRGMWIDIGGYTDRELDDADPVYQRWLRPRLKRGELVAWLVTERGVVVASGALWLQVVQPRPRHPTGVTPYLLSMYTESAHRGGGHAKRIVAAATRWAKKEGYPRMTLHASAMGRPIYEKLGWERTWEMALPLRGPGPGPGPGPGKARATAGVTPRARSRSRP